MATGAFISGFVCWSNNSGVGITGSILVFYEELQELLNTEQIVIVAPPDGHKYIRSLDEIVAAAETIKPKNSEFFKVYYPRNAEVAYKLLYFVNAPGQANDKSGYYVFVNPYTAQITGTQFWYFGDGIRYWGIPFVSFVMQLHYCLLLDAQGVLIVGIVAVLSIISALTGLILWWPLTGKFKQGLTFKRNASAVRLNFDLHKTVGFYSVVFLLPVLFSGIYFNLPDEVNVLVKLFSPITRPDAWEGISSANYHSEVQPGQKPIGFFAAETAVEKRYPTGRLWILNAPEDEHGVYIIQKRDVSELSRFIGYRDFAVDQYSGEILAVYESGAGSAGDIFLDWQWPLHSGQAFGWLGRILVMLSGLAFPTLYVTGVIRWLQKRRAKLVRDRKNATRQAR